MTTPTPAQVAVKPDLRAKITIWANPTRDEIIKWANSALRNSEIDFIDDALIEDFADGLPALQADALPTPSPEEQEPVAWLCEDLIFSGARNVLTDKAHAEARAARSDDWRVTPLYTHPAPVPAVPEEVAKLRARASMIRRLLRQTPEDRMDAELDERSAAIIEAQAAELARLTQERDALKSLHANRVRHMEHQAIGVEVMKAEVARQQERNAAIAAELARLREENALMAASLDEEERKHGLSTNGNMWRFWSNQLLKYHDQRAKERAALDQPADASNEGER